MNTPGERSQRPRTHPSFGPKKPTLSSARHFPVTAGPKKPGRSHKQPEVRTAIEQAGAHLRFLPPYSPDFNPIEMAFAKLKAFLRAARPRTFDHVCELMATALALFMPDECANYVRHCGYRVTT